MILGNNVCNRFAKSLHIIFRSEFNKLMGLMFSHLFEGLPGLGSKVITALFIAGGSHSERTLETFQEVLVICSYNDQRSYKDNNLPNLSPCL